MRSRLPILAVLGSAALLSGCSGATRPMPPLTPSQLALAQDEVQSHANDGRPFRNHVTDEDATTVLRSAVGRIAPAATQTCHEMAIGDCRWTLTGSADRSLNTGINKGIMEYAGNEEEEVAILVARGFGHRAANHYASRRQTRMAGSRVGMIVMTAVSVVVPPLGMATSLIQTATDSGVRRGGVRSPVGAIVRDRTGLLLSSFHARQ